MPASLPPSGQARQPDNAIAALLGHAARGVTQRYVHIDEAVRLADRGAAETARLLDGGQARTDARRVMPVLGDMAETGMRAIDTGEPMTPQPVP